MKVTVKDKTVEELLAIYNTFLDAMDSPSSLSKLQSLNYQEESKNTFSIQYANYPRINCETTRNDKGEIIIIRVDLNRVQGDYKDGKKRS